MSSVIFKPDNYQYLKNKQYYNLCFARVAKVVNATTVIELKGIIIAAIKGVRRLDAAKTKPVIL